jgi:hypothetical protein
VVSNDSRTSQAVQLAAFSISVKISDTVSLFANVVAALLVTSEMVRADAKTGRAVPTRAAR